MTVYVDSSKASIAHWAPDAGWRHFYNTLQSKGKVPDVRQQQINSVNAIFCANVLDITDVITPLEQSGRKPIIITVYTDVLRVTEDTRWQLEDSALVIYARQIELINGASLELDLQSTNCNTTFSLFGLHINGEIRVGEIRLDAANISPGIAIRCGTNNEMTRMPLTLSDGFPQKITQVQKSYLYNGYIYAVLSYYSMPEIALDILRWTKNWAGASSNAELQQLYFRCCSLATNLNSQILAEKTGATYVPYLSTGISRWAARELGTTLLDEQRNYYRLFSTDPVTDDLLDNAKRLAIHSKNNESYVGNLLSQAKSNYDNASQARETALLNFAMQQVMVMTAFNNLQQLGISANRPRGIDLASVNLVEAVAEFGIGIAGIAAGNEEAAPATIQALAAAGEAAAQVKDGMQIVESMKELKKTIQVLDRVCTLSNELFEAGKAISENGDPGKAIARIQRKDKPFKDDGANGVAAWHRFQAEVANGLKPLIDADIEHAPSLKRELDGLATYGKALCTSKLAEIKAAQQWVQLNLQLHYAKHNEANLQNQVAILGKNQQMPLQLQQLFYCKYLEQKCNLFIVLTNHQASYKYWALKNPADTPALTDLTAIHSSLDSQANMTIDQMQALAGIGNSPQKMTGRLIRVDNPDVIARLRKTRKTQWILTLDEEALAQFDRVRISCVRVWLDGDGLYDLSRNKDITLSLQLGTSGSYLDRLGEKLFRFNSANLARIFSYRVSDKPGNATRQLGRDRQGRELYADINIDGSLAPDTQNNYFQPTPFTEWNLSLPKQPEGVDYSKIQTLVLEIQGSVIERGNT